jgi:hypothetical protein
LTTEGPYLKAQKKFHKDGKHFPDLLSKKKKGRQIDISSIIFLLAIY